MYKKKLIILFVMIAVAITLAVLVYQGVSRKTVEKSAEGSTTLQSSTAAPEGNENLAASTANAVQEPVNQEDINSENISIVNNSPEFDLKAVLREDYRKKTFLKLEYYNEGISVLKEFGEEHIPELKSIFEDRENQPSEKAPFRIKEIYLNLKKNKAYFMIKGKADSNSNDLDTALYAFDMKLMSINKLVEGTGLYTDLNFSKDYERMGFSYSRNISSPNHGTGSGKEAYDSTSYLYILNCNTDQFYVASNKNSKGEFIGKQKNDVYNYEFLSWKDNKSAKLRQIPKVDVTRKDTSKTASPKEVVYDIEKDIFAGDNTIQTTAVTNVPGGTAKPSGESSKPQQTVDSEALKALRNYYTYLSKEQYKKVTEILDESFRLKLNILKQFGINALVKSDMDESNMALYGSMLKTARMEEIVLEKNAANVSTIYFYQSYSVEGSEIIRQPMIAALKKTEKGWLLTSLVEANLKDKPFAQ